ncbi:hypothetical protein Fmac_029412 [Flemingia macrophylla]|uniref:NAC domain-containing protein n=1 Tax=Flemingia macrophylla TaxID=520843 RepID=A0ABD1LAA1_9FABA
MEEPIVLNKGEEPLDLPPGFRFHPTDEEIITYYLTEKVKNSSFSAIAIGEADLNKCEPWDLPKKAKIGEKEWYFFCQKDRKYPTGMRTNRATESGYWKATGKDKEIYKGKGNLVGMKKTLVFYKGRAPKGEKTNWVMHEFRLEGKFASYSLPKAAKDEWVVSRVFHKNTDVKKTSIPDVLRINSLGDDLLDYSSLPPLMDPTYGNTNNNGNNDTTNPLSSNKSQSEGYYLPSFSINNNNNQLLIKPQDHHHRTYEIPTINYTSNFNQANLSNNVNPMGSNTLSQPLNMFNDYYMHQNRIKNSIMPSAAGSGFVNHDQAILRALAAKNNEHLGGLDYKQCKMEQFSSNHSQDTGLSNDRNTDTSSVVSKQDNNNSNMGRNRALYEDLEGPSSVAPLSDLEGLQWEDY